MSSTRILTFAFCLLPFYSIGQELKLIPPIGHTSDINSMQFSPNGKRILTGSADRTAKVWDAFTGKLLMEIKGHGNPVTEAIYTKDGKKIITASWDGTCRIWNAETGQELFRIQKPGVTFLSLYINEENSRLIVTGYDKNDIGCAELWDLEKNQLVADITGRRSVDEPPNTTRYYKWVTLSPDKRRAVVWGVDTRINPCIWNVQTGKLIAELERASSFVAFTDDGKKIVTASADSSIAIWDGETGRLLSTIKGFVYARDGMFSQDGKKIVIADSKNVKLVDAESGFIIAEFKDLATKVNISKEGDQVFTISADDLKVWDTRTGEKIKSFHRYIDYTHTAYKFYKEGQKLAVKNEWNKNVLIWDIKKRSVTDSFNMYMPNRIEFKPDGKKIIITNYNNIPEIYEMGTGRLLAKLEGKSSYQYRYGGKFSADGKKILSIADSAVHVWDIKTARKKFNLTYGDNYLWKAEYRAGGARIVTESHSTKGATTLIWDAKIGKVIEDSLMSGIISPDSSLFISLSYPRKIRDLRSGNLLGEFVEPVSNNLIFSRDGKKFIVFFRYEAKIWDLEKKAFIAQLKGHTNYIKTAAFSYDGKKIITGFDYDDDHHDSTDGTARIWDAQTGELLLILPDHEEDINQAIFSPDGTKAVTVSEDDSIRVWDARNGKFLSFLEGDNKNVKSIKFSADSKTIYAGQTAYLFSSDFPYFYYGGGYDNSILKWDAQTGKRIYSPGNITNEVIESVNADSTYFLTTDGTNSLILRNFRDGKILYSLFAIGKNDELTVLPTGYYQATSGAAKLLYYVNKDLKVVSFDQLDVKYNRPDKILEAIGNTDAVLIKSYRRAWEKRIRKLGIDTTAFKDGYSVPDCEIVNRDSIEHEQRAGLLKLHIIGNDSNYRLDRFNVWVNESPIFGQRGIRIRKKNGSSLDTSITIQLSQGTNNIEVSVTNVNGTESYRMPLIVNYTPAIKQRESLRFIGIGIDRFSDSKYNLQYSSKDIRDLSVKLKEKYGADITIDTLFNENVNVTNVKALKQKLQQTTVNDKVIVAYSGHGMLSKEYDYYLSTYSVNFDKPEMGGLPYDELENLLDSIPARKKLMLIDACHSGEVDKEDLVTLEASSDSLIKGLKPVAYKKEGQLGLKNSFELMQSLFVNVGKSTGATIISAAAGTQFALERGDLKNGVFTYSILEAMNKYPSLKISELKKIVGERVEQLTNGMQKPTSRNETIAVDWNLW